MRITTAVLLFSVMTASLEVGANPVNSYLNFPLPSSSSALGKTPAHSPLNTLAKKTALTWEIVGTTRYTNAAGSGEPVDYVFSFRDTTIYNANGNRLVQKSTTATNGWGIDSLIALDSSVYSGSKLIEHLRQSFTHSNTTMQTTGTRSVYTSFNGGKSSVSTTYTWSDSKSAWVPSDKDSLVYTALPTTEASYYSNLVGLYGYEYDTTSSSWQTSYYLAKIAGECNATTLALGGKQTMEADLVDIKQIYKFNSSVWTEKSLIQLIIQQKNTVSGAYYDYAITTDSVDASGNEIHDWSFWNSTTSSMARISRDIVSYNANGDETSKQSFVQGTTPNNLVPVSKSFHYYDAHGNDTLILRLSYLPSTSSWDTTSVYRHTRTYNTDGSNNQTIESEYNTVAASWTVTGKEISTFGRVNVASPVASTMKDPSTTGISVLSTSARSIITAPGLTGLVLYNAAGKIVAAIHQPPAGTLSIEYAGSGSPIANGVYVAKLLRGNQATSLKVSVQR